MLHVKSVVQLREEEVKKALDARQCPSNLDSQQQIISVT